MQLSVVQAFASSHWPAVVQQRAIAAMSAPAHVSVVHTSLSLHSAAVVHVVFVTLLQVPPGPPTHVSVVAALPSLQLAFVVQHPGVAA